MFAADPLGDPEQLIRRVYAYVAYRVGEGSDADDIVGETFERAVRYRDRYDATRGSPISWLIGIARNCIGDLRTSTERGHAELTDIEAPGDLEQGVVERQVLQRAIRRLDPRERELVALRFGADLSAKQIGEQMGMQPNAVDVALHRALLRLRDLLIEVPPHGSRENSP
jgi:RNA polymerase sigma-70 factor (ECF subfamily)